MTAEELRRKYIEFFRGKEHSLLPSASLVPENDPTVLFTTAGMHPLVPFLLGEKHPSGRRLVSCQRCIRTGDIDQVGDDIHLTFFEMLGNWSLGDYFKNEAIRWSWEFLTDKHWLGLNPERLCVSLFKGDETAKRDDESADIWRSLGMPENRIYYFGKEKNWWGPAGQTGPCGPDTEIFFDTQKPCALGRDEKCDPSCDCGRFVEIWNNVFMEYNKTADGQYKELAQRNVDTGLGLERTIQIANGLPTVYATKLFSPLMQIIKNESTAYDERLARIIADHIKASIFILADGVMPSNVEQGYVLRRLIRRSYRYGRQVGFDAETLILIGQKVIQIYSNTYLHLVEHEKTIIQQLEAELEKFSKSLDRGLKILTKELDTLGIFGLGKNEKAQYGKKEFSGKIAFDLYQTYGFPKEMIAEELKTLGVRLNEAEWQAAEKAHQELSRHGAERKFSGGLSDHSEQVVRMHTATHLLHQALRDILGDHVFQKGSNITQKRLRFDFTQPKKMTDEEMKKVETLVNEKIRGGLEVVKKVVTPDEARQMGAIGLFGEKYGDKVSVYLIGDYSKEFCGGPHVKNTKEIGKFKIIKEEASSAGIRRIKAIIE